MIKDATAPGFQSDGASYISSRFIAGFHDSILRSASLQGLVRLLAVYPLPLSTVILKHVALLSALSLFIRWPLLNWARLVSRRLVCCAFSGYGTGPLL